ncbi:MAG: hypothetical protein F4Y40_04410 [Acidimicrobiia bacterium]|nr:hypothetical protein [Acidimicrobiia bacterium]MYF83721.1 hypothetical protein [Acidimicrobiia bacterium]
MTENGSSDHAGVDFRIDGAAGPYEAAVIAAVLEHALAEERRNGKPGPARRFTNWTVAGWNHRYHRPRPAAGTRINGAARPSAPQRSRSRTS